MARLLVMANVLKISLDLSRTVVLKPLNIVAPFHLTQNQASPFKYEIIILLKIKNNDLV